MQYVRKRGIHIAALQQKVPELPYIVTSAHHD